MVNLGGIVPKFVTACARIAWGVELVPVRRGSRDQDTSIVDLE